MESIKDFLATGGLFMYFNIGASIAVLAIIIERTIYFLGRGHINTKAFLEQIRRLLAANNVDRAKKLCDATPAPAARVAKAGLSRYHKGEAAVASAIEESMVDVQPEIKVRIGALWSIANIATLLGLLGTVSGLIHTFGGLEGAKAEDRQNVLSRGISEALNNTAMGLAIAVTCMIAHLFLSAAAKKVVADLEGFTLKLENLLSDPAAQEPQR